MCVCVCVCVCVSRLAMFDPLQPHGLLCPRILKARILEWVAVSFSRESSQPRSKLGLLHYRQILYHLSHQGSLTATY